MKKITPLFFLILILATFAAGLLIWRLVIFRPPPSLPIIPTLAPTPTLLPTPTFFDEGKGESPKEILQSLKEKFPLIEYLPYQTKDYSLDYFAPLSLQVKIKNSARINQIKEEVPSWIQSKGINPSTHKIEYLILVPSPA